MTLESCSQECFIISAAEILSSGLTLRSLEMTSLAGVEMVSKSCG